MGAIVGGAVTAWAAVFFAEPVMRAVGVVAGAVGMQAVGVVAGAVVAAGAVVVGATAGATAGTVIGAAVGIAATDTIVAAVEATVVAVLGTPAVDAETIVSLACVIWWLHRTDLVLLFSLMRRSTIMICAPTHTLELMTTKTR